MNSQRGFSLPEMLVAMLVLAVVATVALSLYDQARRSMHLGENAAEQQQIVRIALDVMSSELLVAGLNTWPDGDRSRPDEQIEAAFEHAIVFRADMDAQDPIDSRDPEDALATGGAYRTVSTGNDEIVAYVLGRPNSTDVLSFEADVAGSPRDGAVETVEIRDVSLSLGSPPYTLYRVTLDEDGSAVRVPLAEQIRSLRFRFYDRYGTERLASELGGAETSVVREARSSIRRIGIEIEGLTRDRDPKWIDVHDLSPDTRRHRKFALATDIKPRNLGLAGLRDVLGDVVPPEPPSAPSLYPGHCAGLWATWPPSPEGDEVEYYKVIWTLASGGAPSSLTTVLSQAYLSPLLDGEAYRVIVQAVDAAGNVSAPSPAATAAPVNSNTPRPTGAVVAERTADGLVDISWAAVLENAENVPTADPQVPALRDLAGYRVYRSTVSGFEPGSVPIHGEAGPAPTPAYTDTTPIGCEESYYRIAAVDHCGLEGEASPEAHVGALSTGRPPKPPYNEDAYWAGDRIRVKWRRVREDVDDRPAWVTHYVVQRAIVPPPAGGALIPDAAWEILEPPLGDVAEFFDDPPIGPGLTAIYRVKAIDGCGVESDWSATTNPPCNFTGELRIVTPAYGATFAGNLAVVVALDGGTPGTVYEEFRLKARRTSDGYEWPVASYPGDRTSWDHVWLDSDSGPAGFYELTAILVLGGAPELCEFSTSVWLHKVDP